MQYTRLVSFLGDKSAPANIRIILPYMLLNTYSNILPVYDFVIHQNPEFYMGIGALQVQKSGTQDQYNRIKYIKSFPISKNFKIFYDVDDLLFDIPEYNPSHVYWNKNKESTKRILELVDYIVCSTPELAKHMSKYNNTIVFKNRLIEGLWKDNSDSLILNNNPNKRLKILWPGGPHHFSSDSTDGDFSEDIISFIEKTTDKYEWIFVGSLPLKLKNNQNITFYPLTQYFDYINLLKTINADIGIALLQDNDFNRCKSNLKALEYTALNIPGIYSNIQPYKNMQCKVNNLDEFIGHLEKMSVSSYRQDVKIKDYKTLKDNLYWDELYIRRYLGIYLGR